MLMWYELTHFSSFKWANSKIRQLMASFSHPWRSETSINFACTYCKMKTNLLSILVIMTKIVRVTNRCLWGVHFFCGYLFTSVPRSIAWRGKRGRDENSLCGDLVTLRQGKLKRLSYLLLKRNNNRFVSRMNLRSLLKPGAKIVLWLHERDCFLVGPGGEARGLIVIFLHSMHFLV